MRFGGAIYHMFATLGGGKARIGPKRRFDRTEEDGSPRWIGEN